MKLEQILEALLFATGEMFTIKELSKLLSKERGEIETALRDLSNSLENRGIRLAWHDDEVVLVSIKEISPIIEILRKRELSQPLSQAALDTLSVVLYASPIEKQHIDLLRGVDSRTILRSLKSKGLVQESIHKEASREKIEYSPTLSLMRYMGIRSVEELNDFETQRKTLLDFIEEAREKM